MTLSVNDTTGEKEVTRSPSKQRRPILIRVFIGLFWTVLIIFLITAILAAYIWVNRYEFMENAAIKALADKGVEAELSITSVSKTQAVLDNIKILDKGVEVFSAGKVTVDYQWRDLRDGQTERIIFSRPKGLITLDEQGKIINDLFSQTNNSEDSGQSFPSGGIKIEKGILILDSPYGSAEATINGEFLSANNFTTAIDIAPTQFSYADWQMEGGGAFNVSLQGLAPQIKTDIVLSNLEHPVLDASNLHIKGDLVPIINGSQLTIDGDIDVDFTALTTAQLVTGPGTLNWQGRYLRDNVQDKAIISFDGNWAANIEAVSSPDPIRRGDLAKTLSLSRPLGKAPIAQNFAPDLTRNILQLLTQSSVAGKGHATLDDNGLSISLDTPAILKAKGTTLKLTQTNWAPLYKFDRKAKDIRLAFHADLSKPAGLSLRETDLVARSDNGWRLDGIKRFSADVSTSREWNHIGIDNMPARLAPFKAEAVYKGAARNGKRDLLLKGNIDYDGVLPGAYVSGLKTGGEMNMNLDGAETILSFAPKDDAPIIIARIDTDTRWRAEDVSVRLLSKTPIYRRRDETSDVNAKLADVSFIAIDRPDVRNLGLNFETMALIGTLKEKEQNWKFTSFNAKICSEDTPGPGTDIRLPDMALEVWRKPAEEDSGSDLHFELSAPQANVKTQLVTAENIAIEASGSPDTYMLTYSPGRENLGQVKFIGEAMPRLPMTGIVNYANGVFIGNARTNLPFSADTPIDVTYRFQNGAGTANVDIPQLRFTPDGLQPQSLVKALRGKIAEVSGLVSAQIKLAFAAGQPLQSSGTAQLKSMNFGTLPGPLSDLNTQLSFSSFFPLQSQGRQTLTVAGFDPGFPLEDGVIEFEIIPDGVKVYSARWPMGSGAIALDPFDWLYSAPENRVVMRIEKVSLGEFLNGVGNGSLEATGDIEGTLPIVLAGVDVKVDGGELAVKDGGTIRYQSSQTNAAGVSNEYAKMAFDALKDFNYRSLTAKIDGPLDGAIEVGMEFDGSNKDVLNNQPFRFSINIEGEFNTNDQIKSELARRRLSREGLPAGLE